MTAECENCRAAQLDPRTLRYSIEVMCPDGSTGTMEFKVAKAQAMVDVDPRPARYLTPAALRRFLERHAEALNQAHLDHLPLELRSRPGLVAQFDELDDQGRQVPTAVLIDGTHRAARALRDGYAFHAYVLTDAEMAACVEVIGVDIAQLAGYSPDLARTPLGA